MIIKYKDNDIQLKYTFNSFKYMEDVNLGDMETLEQTPFRLIGILQGLLLGALNSDPKVYYSPNQVDEILENLIEDEDNNLADTLKGLVELLEESSFFKSLQARPQDRAKAKAKASPKK